MDKDKLDELLETYKAQPVGHGYIDIIVSRTNYKSFVQDLVSNGYKIESISWWEWCPGEKEAEYGLGGPISRYYDGWFSELSVAVDDIEVTEEEQMEKVLTTIETKSISFSDETVTFTRDAWLTPAIWLQVPDEWRNTLAN
jgi:hypothetical protein